MPSELNTAHASAPAATPIAARLCKARTIARPRARCTPQSGIFRSRIRRCAAMACASKGRRPCMWPALVQLPIQPEDASQPGYRDTLVVTLRSGGFQGPGAGTDLQCRVLPRQRQLRVQFSSDSARAAYPSRTSKEWLDLGYAWVMKTASIELQRIRAMSTSHDLIRSRASATVQATPPRAAGGAGSRLAQATENARVLLLVMAQLAELDLRKAHRQRASAA